MAEKMYKKVVDASGNETFVEVEIPETPAATATNKEPKKSFGETMLAVWKKLQPILGGILIGIGGTSAAFWLLGKNSGPDVPTLPGSGNSLGNGTGGIDVTNF